MEILAISGIALVSTVLCLTLKKYHPEYSMIVSIAAGLLILGTILSKIYPAISEIRSLVINAGLSSEYSSILLKTLGICFVTQFSSDCCKDAGESSLASKVELTGKLSIILIALPLFEKITSTATKLISS